MTPEAHAAPRAFLEVTVAAPPGVPAELAAQALVDAGAGAVEEREASADGRAVLVAGIPPDRLPLDAAPLAALGAAVTATRTVPDRDWEAEFRAGLRPLLLGVRLAVLPVSVPAEAPPGRLVVHMDPGSAFGTGLHPTTALCAEALERHLTPERAPVATVDVGTGSGLLAIAAHRLGAAPILAIDNDPHAVEEARRNAARNGCEGAIAFQAASPEALAGTWPLVIANLDRQILAAVGAAVARLVAPGGTLIVSGLRVEHPWPVPAGLTLRETFVRDGWRAEEWVR